jgi:signal transduction histidine kinase
MQLAISITTKMPASSQVDQLLEILSDTNDSSDTVAEILDHLLIFDKVEEGNMDLVLDNVEVKKFLRDCLGPFRLQVRAPFPQSLLSFSLQVN